MRKIFAVVFFACFFHHVPLRAQPAALLDVNPLLLDFGNVEVGGSKALAITLTNLTAAPLPITGFATSGDGAFSVDVNGGSEPCGNENPTLEAMGSCTMAVTFAPVSTESATGSVSFTPNGQDASTISVRFLGQAPTVDTGGCSLGTGSNLPRGALTLIPTLFLAWMWRRKVRA